MTNILFLILGACIPTIFCSLLNLITAFIDNLSELLALWMGMKALKIKQECQENLTKETNEDKPLIGFTYEEEEEEQEEDEIL